MKTNLSYNSPLLFSLMHGTPSIEHILKSIEQNNKKLKGTETCRRCDQDGKPGQATTCLILR